MKLKQLLETMPKNQKVAMKWPIEKNPFVHAIAFKGSIQSYLQTSTPAFAEVQVAKVRHQRGKIIAILMDPSPVTILEEVETQVKGCVS